MNVPLFKPFCACVYFAAHVGKLSYLFIVLMGHTMVVNIRSHGKMANS